MMAKLYARSGLVRSFKIEKPKMNIRIPIARDYGVYLDTVRNVFKPPEFPVIEFRLEGIVDGVAIYMTDEEVPF